MMSSAIPARLQFQCGHAAMVTLPRIKGETATQRNDRVAREKLDALSRQCDFCAPAVTVATNGNSSFTEIATFAPEPEVILAVAESQEDLEELTVMAEAEPDVVIIAELVEPEEPQHVDEVRLEAAEVNSVEAVAEALTALVETAQAAVAETSAPVLEAAVPESTNGEAATATRAPRRRVAQPARKPRAEELARGRRFLVEYRVERVLHAVDIHDALRQAANFGAAQLTAITRED
jgi:hypothetical protein